jgi:DNA (cytosine-5)-methyltransferase 1
MAAYYNEIDPYAAQWLRNLIGGGHIAAGDVDERSIVDVQPDDLKGYTQCHFFAGIGGWSYALRLALWDDSRPVWTGSCPCQPFSKAGNKAAQSDERHLWPHWFRLIRECRPTAVFGEQVEDGIATGWFDDVCRDLEASNYACAAAVLPAYSAKAPHERNRIWFVSYPNGNHDLRGSREDESPAGEEWVQKRNDNRQPVESTRVQASLCDFINLGCKGRWTESVQGQPREPREFEREFADFNGGWSIHSPKLRSVDDGLRYAASQIRAYGNAIVPQVAAEFIKAADGW